MLFTEPLPTAILLTVFGVLLAVSVAFSRASCTWAGSGCVAPFPSFWPRTRCSSVCRGADTIFNVVFFIVVVQALIPGGTVGWVTRRLGLESSEPPRPSAVLEMESLRPLKGDLQSFYVDELLAVNGSRISDLPFPDGAAVMLIVRGQELVAPSPGSKLETGDHVYVVSRDEDKGLIQLMFGRPEE